ncbi:hypothetical protein [Terrabacter sp. Ter38]|uniref:hypothetical protein n=1 Tax=Terrabacter sp. Ter38 TaxID=2926030 RepID=UPI002117E3F1|nr:hypothetical protein [Terrabacter sp. Ter38]
MESVMPYVLAIVPTVGVGALFYFVIKSILEGDRRERLAQARWEAEHDRREAAANEASQPAAPGAEATPTTER